MASAHALKVAGKGRVLGGQSLKKLPIYDNASIFTFYAMDRSFPLCATAGCADHRGACGHQTYVCEGQVERECSG